MLPLYLLCSLVQQLKQLPLCLYSFQRLLLCYQQMQNLQKVYIVYRRGMEELPARKEEVEHAEEMCIRDSFYG